MSRLLALPIMAVVIGALACGSAATEAIPASTQNPVQIAAPISNVEPEVGTSVGNKIPHFEFTLADGTSISTAQLASEGQPAFLFFFTTW